ncbi:hypothetical protein [Trinickia sp. Y13]|uniref:hypothetical protein n=1 Tax=Trinickia sp. Y13 TaxID=2917807 RepID=UPI00240679BB|nr:hypothetical protein [Trinickia sp. Y13]MDG0026293.1 hypothetical protein [Trinickia sp. Y13]
MNEATTIFAGVRWPRLTIGACLTGGLALTIHVVMVQWLKVSNPDFHSPLPEVLNATVMVYAAMWLDRCLRAQYAGRSPALRIFVLFALLACLNATVRNAFMTGYCSTTTPLRWLFGPLSSVSPIVYFAVAAALTAGVCQFRQNGVRLAAGAGVALLLVAVVSPGLSLMEQAAYVQLSALLPSVGWCKLPYGMDVMIPAYLTSVEPALASFACIALVWRYLPERPLLRTVSFVVLILALKKQLLASLLYPFFAPGSALTALASMGQLSLAAAALGLLTVGFWRWVRPVPLKRECAKA